MQISHADQSEVGEVLPLEMASKLKLNQSVSNCTLLAEHVQKGDSQRCPAPPIRHQMTGPFPAQWHYRRTSSYWGRARRKRSRCVTWASLDSEGDLKNRSATLSLATMHRMSGFTSVLSRTSLPTEAMRQRGCWNTSKHGQPIARLASLLFCGPQRTSSGQGRPSSVRQKAGSKQDIASLSSYSWQPRTAAARSRAEACLVWSNLR